MDLIRLTPTEFAEALRNRVIHGPGEASSQYLPLLDVTVWDVSGQIVGLHGGPPTAPTSHYWDIG
jgi:hypothetical protein